MGTQHCQIERDAEQFAIGMAQIGTRRVARVVQNFSLEFDVPQSVWKHAKQRFTIDDILNDLTKEEANCRE